jgi:tetratricopeptide (TPR) repeat protein
MRKLMSRKHGFAVVAFAAASASALFAAPPAVAQGTPPAQPAQQQPPAGQAQQPGAPQTPTPPAQPPVNKEEQDAYKAFYDLTSQQGPQIIAQGEDFLAKYPSSLYRSSVYSKLIAAYLNAGQVDKLVPAGEKALAENPDNVEVLAIVATVLPRTVNSKSLDADQKLNEAERYARHVIEITSVMAKPDGMTDELFARGKNQYQGMAHTALGLVLYMRNNTAASVDEFNQATKMDPNPDPLAYFLLGDGDRKLSKFSDASAAFDACSKSTWVWQDQCKKYADDTKKLAATPPAAKP